MKDKWLRIGLKKRAGVLVPLFFVYSKDSPGITNFSDLKLLIDFCQKSGNSILQFLPLNEAGYLGCPYDSLSSFALDPNYFSIQAEGEKANHVWEAFLQWDHSDSLQFKKFQNENSYWLPDFALYKALKYYFHHKPWYEWDELFKERNQKALQDFKKEREKEIEFESWLQWQLFRQLKEAREYAREKEVFLKGDLPILVSRDSADVWQHRQFFKLEFCAGAPPDMYCAKGQRWGMPTYNWQEIAGDGYRYLKEKLRYAANFYDILRIDHVVGLFRIWSIPYSEPLENQGLNGFFDPADERVWKEHGKKILQVMLENSPMLLCAEDLGVIPQACTDTLQELGIPGNDVQRWTKDYKIKHDFLRPQDYRRLSVAMLSTHDTTNWPAWWENEAGTVDEGLFIRRCGDHRQIDFAAVKYKLFDPARSNHGRLRWREEVDSLEKLVEILGQGLIPKGTVPKEHVLDFIDLYLNSYLEKEKLWRCLGLPGMMREKCDSQIMRAVLKFSLECQAVFSIQLITDWLYLADLYKGDPYQYRFNTPGTTSEKNWSLTIPLPLEELLKHKVTKEIRKMVVDSARLPHSP